MILKVAQNGSCSSFYCNICMDKSADCLVTPCGHQCGCEECLEQIKNTTGICPICRVHIDGIQKVFQAGST